MTKEEFNKLRDDRKKELLKDAKYTDTYLYNGFKTEIYSYRDYFLQVFYHPPEQIFLIKADEAKNLEKYFETINFPFK